MKPRPGAVLTVRDPFNGEELAKLPFATREELASVLARAEGAFAKWRSSPAWERSQLLLEAASRLEARQEEFAELIRREVGKPIDYARAEVKRALGVLRWAAAEAVRFSGELLRLDAGAGGRSGFGIHTRFPRGAVLGITPFNFPLNLAIHKIAPALACGSPIVIKPSPSAPLTARKLVELFDAVPGLVQLALADDEATAELTRAPELRTISFTGSARVGWLIRRQAPEKPTTLELGGNATVIIAEDTPRELLPAIAKRIAAAGFGYSGQSCISVQNALAAAPVFDEFRDLLAEATRLAPYGDPALPGVLAGPVIHAQAAARIRRELTQASSNFTRIDSGALKGASGQEACLLPPTLLIQGAEQREEALPPIVAEEIFGPVISLAKFEQLDSVMKRVNQSRYGLQVGLYTQHWPTIERAYRDLEVGGVIVNDVPTTRYDHQPYGGTKDSGQGREGVRYAMEEMTESKFLALSSELPL
ncbi:MAG: aldehyde dehydrogenase family protein [Oligoflexia bacterium]|nr:aldehyde dehydrogenase family protein [Oligoflexia bacterium]